MPEVEKLSAGPRRGSTFAGRVAADRSRRLSPTPLSRGFWHGRAPFARAGGSGGPRLAGGPVPHPELHRRGADPPDRPADRAVRRALPQGEGASVAGARDADLAPALPPAGQGDDG